MKSASPALQQTLLNIIGGSNPGQPPAIGPVPGRTHSLFVEDLLAVVTGAGQIAVNMRMFPTPGSNSLTVNPPNMGNTPTGFVTDICVRESADYSPVTYIPSGTPQAGQYTFTVANNPSLGKNVGFYQFADSAAKLVTYVMGFGPLDPQTYFWTTGGGDIFFGSKLYSSFGPYLSRVKTTTAIGLQVDSVEMELAATPEMQLTAPQIAILQGFANGVFDGATVLVHRVFMRIYGDVSEGGVVHFKGSIGDVGEVGRTHARFNINSRVEILNRQVPRRTFGPACDWVLYDAGCTLDRSAYAVNGTVQAGSNASQILMTPNPAYPGDIPAPTLPAVTGVVTPQGSGAYGVNLHDRIEYAVYTWITRNGESLPSPDTTGAGVAGNQLLLVSYPGSPPSGAIGWNLYIGEAPGDEMLQNAVMIPLSQNPYRVLQSGAGPFGSYPFTGPSLGVNPPIIATSGYFALGTIYFTSGPNRGLSRYIQDHLPPNATAGGPPPPGSNPDTNPSSVLDMLFVVPPLPFAPQAGDTFVAFPGCNKTYSVCTYKFVNQTHFGGFPYIPDPSQTV